MTRYRNIRSHIKLPKRRSYEMLIVGAFLLGSCGQNAALLFTEDDQDRIDVADANARNAIARINELEGRVEELEQLHSANIDTLQVK